jgi:voltage-gated potassium channel Kch
MSQNLRSASPSSSSSYAVPHVVGAPLSPRSTASLLAATIEERENTHNGELRRLHKRIESLEELVGNEQDDEPPAGFIRNDGKIRNFDIPMGDGLYLPAKFIQQHPADYTKAEGLTGKEFASESPYSIEVYAAPDLRMEEVPEPLPLWVQTIIKGRTATFESLRRAAIELADFGVVADLTRARDTYLKAQEMELQRDQIEADLALLHEKYALTRGCLELARISKHLTRQQYLVPAVLRDDENFPRIPPKTCNMKRGRFAV